MLKFGAVRPSAQPKKKKTCFIFWKRTFAKGLLEHGEKYTTQNLIHLNFSHNTEIPSVMDFYFRNNGNIKLVYGIISHYVARAVDVAKHARLTGTDGLIFATSTGELSTGPS